MSEKIYETRLGPLKSSTLQEWIEIYMDFIKKRAEEDRVELKDAVFWMDPDWVDFFAEIESLDEMKPILELYPRFHIASYHISCLNVKIREGNFSDAKEIIEELSQIYDSDPEYFSGLAGQIGFAWLKMGKKQKFEEWLSKEHVEIYRWTRRSGLMFEEFCNAGYPDEGIKWIQKHLPYDVPLFTGRMVYDRAEILLNEGREDIVWQLVGMSLTRKWPKLELLTALLEYYLEKRDSKTGLGVLELIFRGPTNKSERHVMDEIQTIWKQFELRKGLTESNFDWFDCGRFEKLGSFLENVLREVQNFEEKFPKVSIFSAHTSKILLELKKELMAQTESLGPKKWIKIQGRFLKEYALHKKWKEIQEGLENDFFDIYDGHYALFIHSLKGEDKEEKQRLYDILMANFYRGEGFVTNLFSWWDEVSQEEVKGWLAEIIKKYPDYEHGIFQNLEERNEFELMKELSKDLSKEFGYGELFIALAKNGDFEGISIALRKFIKKFNRLPMFFFDRLSKTLAGNN